MLMGWWKYVHTIFKLVLYGFFFLKKTILTFIFLGRNKSSKLSTSDEKRGSLQ